MDLKHNTEFYKILETLYTTDLRSIHDIESETGISAYHLVYVELKRMGFIQVDNNNENWIYLTAEGKRELEAYMQNRSEIKKDKKASIFNYSNVLIAIIATVFTVLAFYCHR